MLRSELLWSFPAVSWTRCVWISELLSRGENLDLWGMSRGKYSAQWCLDLQVETERPVLFVSFCSLNHFFFLGKNRWKIFSAVSCSVSSDRESGPLSCYSETKCQELFITSFSFFFSAIDEQQCFCLVPGRMMKRPSIDTTRHAPNVFIWIDSGRVWSRTCHSEWQKLDVSTIHPPELHQLSFKNL